MGKKRTKNDPIPRREIDPITLEVVRNKLDGIANEMELTLLKSSFSPIVKEGMDASASLFTVDGETIAQACAIPIHLATMGPVVKSVLDTYPIRCMKEGDIFILNDPYHGGTHLPDFGLVMPVFSQTRVVALSCTMTHHQDVGGMVPGSVPTHATEIYQEGLRVPLVKLRDGGEVNETLVKLLRLNVRMPDIFMGDLNAQIAGCTIGARRIAELANGYGDNHLISMFQELLDRSEQMTRTSLRTIPEGIYRNVDYLDNDGIDLDKRVRIEVAVTVKDGAISFDFTGTSPQVKGPFNCVPSGTAAAACYAIRALTDSRIPTNGGCFRPIKLHLPKGSLLDPIEPAPVNSRTQTIKLAAACIIGAFADVLPDKVPASDAVDQHIIMWAHRRPDGTQMVAGECVASGAGGSKAGDGTDVVDTDVTNCMNMPVEALEMDMPLLVRRTELRCDSGGAGRHRGGLGLVREYEALEDEITLTHRGERFYSSPRGTQGGGNGMRSRSVVTRADGEVVEIPSKLVLKMNKGDRLVIETAGGGGLGDPRDREPATVLADVKNRKVGSEAAAELYGVAVEAVSDFE